jgi:hypothetical protein
MKLNRTKQLLSWVMIIGMVLVACTPEDGDVGPAGPIGPEGPIGPQGDDGQDGQDGQDGRNGNDGVANISTTTFTVLNADYTIFVQAGTGSNFYSHRDTLLLADITQEVVDDGTIQVFRKSIEAGASPSYNAMPYSRGGIGFNYAFTLGEVQLEISYGNNAPIALSNAEYKVVVIPPAQLVKGTEGMEWEELKQIYRLDDLGLSEE